MKITKGLLAFCIVSNIFANNPAQSIDQIAKKILSETIVDRIYENPFKLGLSIKNWKYTEYALGEQFMQDSGLLKGFNLAFENRIKTKQLGIFELDLSGSFVEGGTDYDGGLQGFNSAGDRVSIPYSSNSKNSILTTSLMIGRIINLNNGDLLIPKFGFQYRRLKNPELPEEDFDYTRKATYKTLPIGLAYKKMINSRFTFSSQIIFHAVFSGKTYTQTSDVGGNDKTYIQKDGSGLELSLDFALRLEKLKNKELVISPYFSSWRIDDSAFIDIPNKPGFVSYEPENNTKSLGLDLSIAL